MSQLLTSDSLDGLVTGTPRGHGSNIKRKSNFETPSAKSSRTFAKSSPGDFKTPQTNGETDAANSL